MDKKTLCLYFQVHQPWCYPAFNLAKGRSLGFASATADYTPSSDSVSYTHLDVYKRQPLTKEVKARKSSIRPLVQAPKNT